MALIVNGTTIPTSGNNVVVNGTNVTHVYANNVLVWQKAQYYAWVLSRASRYREDSDGDLHTVCTAASAALYRCDSNGNLIGNAVVSYNIYGIGTDEDGIVSGGYPAVYILGSRMYRNDLYDFGSWKIKDSYDSYDDYTIVFQGGLLDGSSSVPTLIPTKYPLYIYKCTDSINGGAFQETNFYKPNSGSNLGVGSTILPWVTSPGLDNGWDVVYTITHGLNFEPNYNRDGDYGTRIIYARFTTAME